MAGRDRAVRRRAVRLAARQPDLLGSLAILGMFVLVRAAGGGPWLALRRRDADGRRQPAAGPRRGSGRSTSTRVAAMIWARRCICADGRCWPGVVLGVGACFEVGRPVRAARRCCSLELLRGVVRAGAAGAARWRAARRSAWSPRRRRVFIGLLAVLDRIAPPYDPIAGKLVTGGVFGHIRHMISYAAQPDQPARAAGDRLLPVAVADRPASRSCT